MGLQRTYEITRKEFGDAIIGYISSRCGIISMPYQIISSSITLPEKISVEITDEPLSPPSVSREPKKIEFFEGASFSLSRDEIYDGLTREIDLMKRGRKYEGNCVISLSIPLPEKVIVKLHFIPKGSWSKDFQHIFDGSLKQE